jgi:hypothetical protein
MHTYTCGTIVVYINARVDKIQFFSTVGKETDINLLDLKTEYV